MRPRKAPQRMAPEQSRTRRMLTYPSEMWQMLASIASGKHWQRSFASQNEASRFMSRYYRFRIDAIEARAEGALYLREVEASGSDSLGATYNSAGSGIPPITITWRITGDALAARAAEAAIAASGERQLAAPARQLTSGEPLILDLDLAPASEDKHDKQLRDIFGLQDQGRAPTANSEQLSGAVCEHEWDQMETFCLKCKRPHPSMQ